MSNREGIKETFGKLNYELDFEFITALAERMDANKGKYPPYNWKLPMNVEKLKQALFRHVIDIMKDNYADDGRDFGHIEAAACDLMMILYQLKRKATSQKSGRLIDFTNIEQLREIAFYKFINGEYCNVVISEMSTGTNNIFSESNKLYLVLTDEESVTEVRKKIELSSLHAIENHCHPSIFEFLNFSQWVEIQIGEINNFGSVLAIDNSEHEIPLFGHTFYIYYVGDNK